MSSVIRNEQGDDDTLTTFDFNFRQGQDPVYDDRIRHQYRIEGNVLEPDRQHQQDQGSSLAQGYSTRLRSHRDLVSENAQVGADAASTYRSRLAPRSGVGLSVGSGVGLDVESGVTVSKGFGRRMQLLRFLLYDADSLSRSHPQRGSPFVPLRTGFVRRRRTTIRNKDITSLYRTPP